MNIGLTIKAIRKGMGQTQKEFAEGMGMTQTTISTLESDPTSPPAITLKKISEYSKVPLPCIYLWSITDEDLPEDTNDLWPSVIDLANRCFKISK